jgi:hypothetical protein
LVKLADSNNALLIKIRNAEKDRVEDLKSKNIYRQIKWGIAVAIMAVFIIVQINESEIRSISSSSQKPSVIEIILTSQNNLLPS